jgi:hypothetical protein
VATAVAVVRLALDAAFERSRRPGS